MSLSSRCAKTSSSCFHLTLIGLTLEKDVSLVVPYSEIESVKLVDDLLNVIIDIETNSGGVRLTTQQKELSDIRLSGIYASQYADGYKNWHAENVDTTLEALSELGCAA